MAPPQNSCEEGHGERVEYEEIYEGLVRPEDGEMRRKELLKEILNEAEVDDEVSRSQSQEPEEKDKDGDAGEEIQRVGTEFA